MNFKFIGRQAELDLLARAWNRQAAQFLILSGRHQVGKTALMMEWLRQNQPRVFYWVPPASSPVEQLCSFSQALYQFMHSNAQVPDGFTYDSWEDAFEEIALLAQNQRLALVIDEFPTILKTTPNLAGKLKIAWDHQLSRSNLLICLVSADRSIILRNILSYQAPLYGRASFNIELKPFYFGESHSFFPEQSVVDRMALYSFAGGLPAYWNRIKHFKTIPEMIAGEFLDFSSPFQKDIRSLLKNFRVRSGNLDSILGALAHGVQTIEAIARITSQSSARKYLRLLIDAGFVEQNRSLIHYRSTRCKRYQLTDPALRFYFRFLTGRQTQIASSEREKVLAEIVGALPDFIGQFTWKELCREWMICAGALGWLPAFPGEVGSVWNDQTEVGVAGVNVLDKVIFLGECVWDTELADQEILTELVAKKAPLLIPAHGDWKVIYLGFSRSGWTRQALAYQDEINRSHPSGSNWRTIGMHLLDLGQVERGLNEMIKRHPGLQGEIAF